MAARITETEFLKRAEQRFGDQFDYSEMRWRSFKSPVKIRCRRHPVQRSASRRKAPSDPWGLPGIA